MWWVKKGGLPGGGCGGCGDGGGGDDDDDGRGLSEMMMNPPILAVDADPMTGWGVVDMMIFVPLCCHRNHGDLVEPQEEVVEMMMMKMKIRLDTSRTLGAAGWRVSRRAARRCDRGSMPRCSGPCVVRSRTGPRGEPTLIR